MHQHVRKSISFETTWTDIIKIQEIVKPTQSHSTDGPQLFLNEAFVYSGLFVTNTLHHNYKER